MQISWQARYFRACATMSWQAQHFGCVVLLSLWRGALIKMMARTRCALCVTVNKATANLQELWKIPRLQGQLNLPDAPDTCGAVVAGAGQVGHRIGSSAEAANHPEQLQKAVADATSQSNVGLPFLIVLAIVEKILIQNPVTVLGVLYCGKFFGPPKSPKNTELLYSLSGFARAQAKLAKPW